MLLVVEGPPTSRMGLEHSDALVWEQMRKLFFGVEAESVCFGAVFDFGFDYMVREALFTTVYDGILPVPIMCTPCFR